jgi:hypothetical protein
MARKTKKASKHDSGAATLKEYLQKSIVETRYRRPAQPDTVVGRQDRPVSREAGPAGPVRDNEPADRWDEA